MRSSRSEPTTQQNIATDNSQNSVFDLGFKELLDGYRKKLKLWVIGKLRASKVRPFVET